MKRFAKSVLGVTLLEIMLVLAIAAMVIVMSVRYYQSANINQQTNAFISQMQAAQAAADSLAQGVGSYSGANITQAQIESITGGPNSMNTPWGGTIIITAESATQMKYVVSDTPAAVCTLVTTRLGTDTHWTVDATCENITYDSTVSGGS